MKRIIIELDDLGAEEIFKKNDLKIENHKVKCCDIYTPINILPKEIEKIRNGINELQKKGFTSEVVRSYILRKYNVNGSAYDLVLKGLCDILNNINAENKLNKLIE